MPAVTAWTLEPWEELERRALVDQAWELPERSSPYLVDSCTAIMDWHERRALGAV